VFAGKDRVVESSILHKPEVLCATATAFPFSS
jgi:hypothetical protein